MDLDTIEQIKHYKFAPWNKSTLYLVQISKLPKEEAAVAHNALIDQSWCQDTAFIYTNALFIANKSTGIRVGLIAKDFTNDG